MRPVMVLPAVPARLPMPLSAACSSGVICAAASCARLATMAEVTAPAPVPMSGPHLSHQPPPPVPPSLAIPAPVEAVLPGAGDPKVELTGAWLPVRLKVAGWNPDEAVGLVALGPPVTRFIA